MHGTGSPETSVAATTATAAASSGSASTTITTSTATTATATASAIASNYASAAVASEASASPSTLHSPLQHQSKSFPPRLNRTPSISSQSSLDSTPTRQSVNDNAISVCFHPTISLSLPLSICPFAN